MDNVSYAPPKPASRLEVEYKNGSLSIVADHVNLSQILDEIRRQTGTEISIPPGAAQEQIVAGIAPLPLREALVSLLNGSRFNFIMVDSEREPGKLKSVILTYRGAGGASQPAIPMPPPPVAHSEPEPEPQPTEAETQPEPQSQPQPEGAGQQENSRRQTIHPSNAPRNGNVGASALARAAANRRPGARRFFGEKHSVCCRVYW